jgi:hypothetical protein
LIAFLFSGAMVISGPFSQGNRDEWVTFVIEEKSIHLAGDGTLRSFFFFLHNNNFLHNLLLPSTKTDGMQHIPGIGIFC